MNARRLVSYASLGAATKALTLPLISYLPPFYATQAGLPIATVGVLFMAARFWDVLIDPVVGFVMDRYNAPLGRRKFWILLSLPLILGSLWSLFVPGDNVNIYSFGLLLFVFYVGWTILTMSHAAWPAELTTRSEERVRLVAWREWAGVIGMISAVALPAVLEQTSKPALGDQLRVIATFVAVVLPLTAIIALVFLPDSRRSTVNPLAPSAAWQLLRQSSRLRRLLAADLLSGAAYAMISATSYFVMADYLGVGQRFSSIMAAFFLGMIIGVPLLMRLSVSRGTATGFAVAMSGAALMTLMFAIAPQGSFVAAACVNALVGFFTGGYQFNLNAAMVEIADEHRRESQQDAVAMHFALLALTNKIGYAVAVGVTYVMLGAFGYSAAGAGTQAPPTALLLTIGLVLPALLFVSAAFAFYRLPHSPRLATVS